MGELILVPSELLTFFINNDNAEEMESNLQTQQVKKTNNCIVRELVGSTILTKDKGFTKIGKRFRIYKTRDILPQYLQTMYKAAALFGHLSEEHLHRTVRMLERKCLVIK